MTNHDLASLERLFNFQRFRAGTRAERIVARYQRRMQEAEPHEVVENRGLKQAWHRDSSDQRREVGE